MAVNRVLVPEGLDGNERAGKAAPQKGMAAGLNGAPQRSPGAGSVRQFV